VTENFENKKNISSDVTYLQRKSHFISH